MFDRDKMNNAHSQEVAQTAMALIDRMQNHSPPVQVLSAAAVFLCLAEHYRVPAQDAFTAIKNMMNGVSGKTPEFRAVMDYIHYEL